MSNAQSFISAFGNALKTVKNRAYESIDKLGYDLFYSDPRKTRVKLLKNKQVKTNQQKLIYEKQIEKQNKFQQLRDQARERKSKARKNRPKPPQFQKQRKRKN